MQTAEQIGQLVRTTGSGRKEETGVQKERLGFESNPTSIKPNSSILHGTHKSDIPLGLTNQIGITLFVEVLL